MKDTDPGVRYWGAFGLLVRGADDVRRARTDLLKSLEDSSASVRIAAAEALGMHGPAEDLPQCMDVLLKHADSPAHGSYVAMLALNAISQLGERARPYKEKIARLTAVDP